MSQPVEPISLEYALPTDRSANIALLRVCRWAGLLPSVVGFLIVTLYEITGSTLLPLAGVYWLIIGGIIAFAAFCASLVFLAQAYKLTVDRALNIRRGIICVLLALANIPVALLCTMIGEALMDLNN